MGSHRLLYVLIDSNKLSMVLIGSQWFSYGSDLRVLIDILDAQLVIIL